MLDSVTNERLSGTAAAFKRQALIVVVSRTPEVCEGLLASLRGLGYRAAAVAFAAPAAPGQPWRGLHPSLVITDCSPDLWSSYRMTGDHQTEPTAPVIFLIDPEHREQRLPLWLNASVDFLASPYSLAQLAERVETRLEAERRDHHEYRQLALEELRRNDRRQVARRGDDSLRMQGNEHDRRQRARGRRPAGLTPVTISGRRERLGSSVEAADVKPISVRVMSGRGALIESLGSALAREPSIFLTGGRLAQTEDLRVWLGQESADLVMLDTELIVRLGVDSLGVVRDTLPQARLILLWDDAYPLAVEEIVRWGVCGYVPLGASPQHCARAIHEVSQGSLWLPHWIMSHAFRKLSVVLGSDNRAGDSKPPERTAWPSLTAREELIAKLAAHGKTNKEIGRELSLAPDTIKKHLQAVFDKVGVRRRSQLVYCLDLTPEMRRE